MRRPSGFGRTIAWGAIAGIGALAALPLLGPVLGGQAAVRLAIVLSGVGLAIASAPSRPRRVAAGLAGTGIGIALLWLPLGVDGTALGAAAGLALLRSGVLHRSPPWRAVVVEAGLGLAGLGLAGLLADGSGAGLALGLWGYALIQSLFFLIGGAAPRHAEAPADPFDRARGALLALLD